MAILVGALLVFTKGSSTVGATGYNIDITGTVTNPSSAGVSGASVYATDPGTNTVEGGPVITASDGTYDLPITIAGTYDIHFDPPNGSGLNSVVDSNVTVLGSQVIDMQFTPTTHTFSGTLTDENGNPLSGYQISLTNGPNGAGASDTTDTNGNFSISAISGTYTLHFYESGGHNGLDLLQTSNNFSPAIDLSSGNVSKDLELNFVAIHVTLEDANGSPVSNVGINAYGSSNAVTISGYTGGAGVQSTRATTDSNGHATLETLAGIGYNAGSGSYAICASTTPATCLSSAVTITSDTNITLQEPLTYTFSGTLTDQHGNPLPGYQISLTNGPNGAGTSANTDTNGNYSMNAIPGTYTLHIYESGGHNGLDLLQTGTNFSPTIDLSGGNVLQNLTLNFAAINVTVEDTNGNPVPNVSVYANGSSTPVTISGYTGGAGIQSTHVTTDSNGHATLETLDGAGYNAGSGSYAICASTTPVTTCLTSAVTINGDTKITLQIPHTYTFSGTLTDQHGNPLSGYEVGLLNGPNGVGASVKTDMNGNYSISEIPGTYTLHIDENSGLNGIDLLQTNTTTTPTINLNSDISQDLELNFVAIHVTLKDVNGNPIPNVSVYANGSATPVNISGYTGNAGVNSSHVTTDSNGDATLETLAGVGYNAGSGSYALCATTTPVTCLSSAVTISGDTNLILQPIPPTPSAPTNLTAMSPTKTAPALSWDAASGATSYNIYRNGTKIGTSTTTSYTDSAATADGTYSYYITAVNSGGEGGASNTVSVLVDKTRPTVSFTAPTSFAGPFTTGPMVSIAASDSGSGLQVMAIHVYTSTGQLLTTCGSATPAELTAGSMSCDLSSLPAGTYSIRAGATDKAGNNQTILSGSFTIGG